MAFVIYEEETYLILYILTKKIVFGDDLICDVIIQEPVWKLRHNCRHEINRVYVKLFLTLYTHNIGVECT